MFLTLRAAGYINTTLPDPDPDPDCDYTYNPNHDPNHDCKRCFPM